MKKIAPLLVSLLIVALLAVFGGCGNNGGSSPAAEPQTAPERTAVNIATLKGPTGMGMAYLMSQDEAEATANDYTFTVAGAPDDIVAGLTTGEYDIAALPTNTIAILSQKTEGDICALAVNTLGVLYVLEKGDSIQTMADLKGKTILTAGQGTTVEYVLNELLARNGLTVNEDITVEYASEHAEVATRAQAGDYDVVLLPEPFVTSLTTQSPDFRVALNVTTAWQEVTGTDLPMGGLAISRAFYEAHPEAVAAFLTEYAASVEYCNANPAQAAPLIEQYDIMTAAVAEKAIPNCNIVCFTGQQMQEALSGYYQILLAAKPQSIGGALPAEDFYLTVTQ